MNGTFTKSNRTTLGRENFSFDYSINNFIYRINLKDFGGQAEFKNMLIDQNFDNLNINGILVCFDISTLITFWGLDDYISVLKNLKIPLVLCGMKSDKPEPHQVSPNMMKDYLKKCSSFIGMCELSSQLFKNMYLPFELLIGTFKQQFDQQYNSQSITKQIKSNSLTTDPSDNQFPSTSIHSQFENKEKLPNNIIKTLSIKCPYNSCFGNISFDININDENNIKNSPSQSIIKTIICPLNVDIENKHQVIVTIDSNLMARTSIAVPLPTDSQITISNSQNLVPIQKQLAIATKTKLILGNVFSRSLADPSKSDEGVNIINQYAKCFSSTSFYKELIINSDNKIFMSNALTNLFNNIFIRFTILNSYNNLPPISSYAINRIINDGIGSMNDIKFILTAYLLSYSDLGNFIPNLFSIVYNNVQEFNQTYSPKPNILLGELDS